MSVMTVESRMSHREEHTLRELAAGTRIAVVWQGKRRAVMGGLWATIALLDGMKNWNYITLPGGIATLTDTGHRVLAEIDEQTAEASGTKGTSQP